MIWLRAILVVACLAGGADKSAKKSPASKPAAVAAKAIKPASHPKPAKIVAAKPATSPASKLLELDKLCRRDQSWGKLQAVRDRCSDLEPRSSAVAQFWRLTLSDDPNELRKGFAPATLSKAEPDARLLLAAGRYHFARGQVREMEDLVQLARKQKLTGLEIDSLKRLAAGK